MLPSGLGSFQKYVVGIAIIILIGALTVIGVSLYSSKFTADYPPSIASCPDYWTVDNDTGACTNPDPATGEGSDQCNEMNFENPGADDDGEVVDYNGGVGNCRKNGWALNCATKGYKISWDGITNNPSVCS